MALQDEGKIQKPLLEITYREKQGSLIDPNDKETCCVPSTYFVDYYQGVPAFEQGARIGLIIVGVLALVAALVKMIIWRGRNPAEKVGRQIWCKLFMRKLIYEVAHVWSGIMLFSLFIISARWFTFYKMAEEATVLMPSTQEGKDVMYSYFSFLFYMTLATKTLAVVLKIYEQSNADVFVMDWESEAGGGAADREADNARQDEPEGDIGYGHDSGAIAWRSIFVANEFNELQTEMRKIQPATTLIWFTALYIGLGWQWIA